MDEPVPGSGSHMPQAIKRIVNLAGATFAGSLYQRPQALAAAFCQVGFPSVYIAVRPIHRAYLAWRRVDVPSGMRLRTAWCLPRPLTRTSRTCRYVSDWMVRRRLMPLIADDCLVIASHPIWAEAVSGADDRGARIVYDCYDDYAKLAPSKQAELDRQESQIIQHACLATVTTRQLGEKLKALRPDLPVQFLPNAVEFSRFREAEGSGRELRRQLGITGPVAGFLGAIYDWVDEPLLYRLATALPDVTLLMCGPVQGFDSSRLEKLPNVRFTGRIPYDLVPQYIDSFDVALVPFRLIERMNTVNSNKFYQYLSLGKPIVTVDIPSVHEFGDLMLVAADADDYCRKVRTALGSEFAACRMVDARIRCARENSWLHRAKAILAALEAIPARKA